ncbi:MAG: cysteine--tRNA ligase [Phycisphaerae bacterium]|nr:cysteine--tRNA ligase [Phycisphaerae bacterium]
MGLRVYNTLGRRVEEFTPIRPGHVGMYVCGPTVYGHSHLGHAKSYVAFDAIVRWLRFSGYDVNYVQNITDVGHLTDDADAGEDKVVAEARRRGLHPMAVVETFMRSYLDDMDALHLVRPDIMPRATGHVPEQIEQTAALLARGHAYEVNGSVYFSVASFSGYGKLSGRKTAELEAGARVSVSDEKRDPADFALWKRAEAGHLMRWKSPWGEGFPGWHIECSAMSQKYLGESFDIHGGGLENQFPHHECEIAQAECATGRPFARYWLHNNMCTLNGQKMGKSLGNAISLKQMFSEGHKLLAQTFEPAVVKHFILTSHYRQNLDFSNEALQAAQSGSHKLRDTLTELQRWSGGATAVQTQAALRSAIAGVGDALRKPLSDFVERVAAAMDDDFNTAAAIAVMFEFVREANKWLREDLPSADRSAIATVMQTWIERVFGFRWREAASAGGGRENQLIGLLAELRTQVRKEKNFALGDRIRDGLAAIGITLRDTPEGPRW